MKRTKCRSAAVSCLGVFLFGLLVTIGFFSVAPESLLAKPCGDCEGGYIIPAKNLLDSQLIKYYLQVTEEYLLDDSFYELDKTNKPILMREKILEIIYKKNGTEDINIYATSIEDLSLIKIKNIDIVLINSDFNINFKIKRNNLFSIL